MSIRVFPSHPTILIGFLRAWYEESGIVLKFIASFWTNLYYTVQAAFKFTAPNHIALNHTVLNRTALTNRALNHSVLNLAALNYISLNKNILNYTTLNNTSLNHTAMTHTALNPMHRTALQWTTLHWTRLHRNALPHTNHSSGYLEFDMTNSRKSAQSCLWPSHQQQCWSKSKSMHTSLWPVLLLGRNDFLKILRQIVGRTKEKEMFFWL